MVGYSLFLSQDEMQYDEVPHAGRPVHRAHRDWFSLAEVVWTAQGNRNHEDFKLRLQLHLARLDQLDVNYRPPGNDELTFSGKVRQAFWSWGIEVYFWWNE